MDTLRIAYAANLNRAAEILDRLSISTESDLSYLEGHQKMQAQVDAGEAIWSAADKRYLTVPEIVRLVDELRGCGFTEPDATTNCGELCANLFFSAMSDFIYPLDNVCPQDSLLDPDDCWPPTESQRIRMRQSELKSEATGCRIFARMIETGNSMPPSPPGAANGKWQFLPGAVAYGGIKFLVNGAPWKLLKVLVESKNPLSESELIEAGWGHDSNTAAHTLANRLSELRKTLQKKLSLPDGDDPIPVVDVGSNRAWKLDDTLR